MDLDDAPETIVSIDDLDPLKVAIGLTYIETELFSNINTTEMSRMIFRQETVEQDSCPDITALLSFQKRLIKLFITCVLEPEEASQRAYRISFIVKVCNVIRTYRCEATYPNGL